MKHDVEGEILEMLRENELTVAFITRFLGEMGFEVSRQKVERTLRRLVHAGVVESRIGNNGRKHYRLAR